MGGYIYEYDKEGRMVNVYPQAKRESPTRMRPLFTADWTSS